MVCPFNFCFDDSVLVLVNGANDLQGSPEDAIKLRYYLTVQNNSRNKNITHMHIALYK